MGMGVAGFFLPSHGADWMGAVENLGDHVLAFLGSGNEPILQGNIRMNDCGSLGVIKYPPHWNFDHKSTDSGLLGPNELIRGGGNEWLGSIVFDTSIWLHMPLGWAWTKGWIVLMFCPELGRFDLLTDQTFFLTKAKVLSLEIRKFEKRDSSEISRMVKIMRFRNPSVRKYVDL